MTLSKRSSMNRSCKTDAAFEGLKDEPWELRNFSCMQAFGGDILASFFLMFGVFALVVDKRCAWTLVVPDIVRHLHCRHSCTSQA